VGFYLWGGWPKSRNIALLLMLYDSGWHRRLSARVNEMVDILNIVSDWTELCRAFSNRYSNLMKFLRVLSLSCFGYYKVK